MRRDDRGRDARRHGTRRYMARSPSSARPRRGPSGCFGLHGRCGAMRRSKPSSESSPPKRCHATASYSVRNGTRNARAKNMMSVPSVSSAPDSSPRSSASSCGLRVLLARRSCSITQASTSCIRHVVTHRSLLSGVSTLRISRSGSTDYSRRVVRRTARIRGWMHGTTEHMRRTCSCHTSDTTVDRRIASARGGSASRSSNDARSNAPTAAVTAPYGW